MIDYSEDWLFSLIFQWKGSVYYRATLFAVPCTCWSLILLWMDEWLPGFRDEWGFKDLGSGQLWSATTGVLMLLLSFRTNRAMARFWEGTGLLHQMRGEWFDSISCCVTFSVGAVGTKRREVMRFRHTVVRLMSLCHGSALEEIAGHSDEVETIDPYGLSDATLQHLKDSKTKFGFNRVEVLLHLTQSLITKALEDGVLKIPPPILSRVYQTLSRGFVNLLNAKKIADTRFPFPYAQLITLLLALHTVLTPIFMTSLLSSKMWAPLMTFVPIFAFFAVNFVGVELENPFGSDDNDLPLEHFQGEMNKCLMMLVHESADLIADIADDRCLMEYDILAETLEADILEPGHKRVSSFAPFGKTPRGTNKFGWSGVCSSESLDAFLTTTATVREVESEQVEMKKPAVQEKKVEVAFNAGSSVPQVAASVAPAAGTEGSSEEKLRSSRARNVQVTSTSHDANTLLMLNQLVETQVRELSRSITALSDFSSALPRVIDVILERRCRELVEGSATAAVDNANDVMDADEWLLSSSHDWERREERD
eukprot:TRINITY_DN6360_c0_g1_i1.p1 TRINITY_DN6360_c0_g1~~TRINITY_DN6360_c0_g1_i1.p1  ORF type:complete len:538 (-),score=96.90 TRINITY_DN6360_c0_g1_i1:144-1757(-)